MSEQRRREQQRSREQQRKDQQRREQQRRQRHEQQRREQQRREQQRREQQRREQQRREQQRREQQQKQLKKIGITITNNNNFSKFGKMNLDCVLTACNNDNAYSEFIPYFIKAWKKFYPATDVKIVFINDTIPDKFKKYQKHIILFKPLPGVSTVFTAQYIRILYPALLKEYNSGILITDMDMFPMNRHYFTRPLQYYDNDKFICYYKGSIQNEIIICYNIASSYKWSKVSQIKNLDDINNRLSSVFNENKYQTKYSNHGSILKTHPTWSLDQQHLCNNINKWRFIRKYDNNGKQIEERNRGDFVVINQRVGSTTLQTGDTTQFSQLSEDIKNKLKKGYYDDFHSHTPCHKFRNMIEGIIKI